MNRTCEIHDTILQDDLKLRERPLKVLAAVDSFKGSMTSVQAGMAVKKGLKKNYKNREIEVVPVADGGEGTMDAIAYGKSNMKRHTVNVTGPLGQVVKASYISYDEAGEKVALIEMAEAAGLPLVPEEQRDPMHTTTYGVGEMIRDAVSKGCERFIIGIGGSATNDGGIGMLQALGFSCLDADGRDVPYGAEGLGVLERIISPYKPEKGGNTVEFFCVGDSGMHSGDDVDVALKLSYCTFSIACDVTNPLVGELGCSRVFAPQKGADAESVELMDVYMKHYADVVERSVEGKFDRYTPGSGAAGGLGYAFLMFLGGKLTPGIDIVLSETGLEADVEWADTVITGEGRIDAQTMMGKTPSGVARLAKKHGKYVIAIGGCLGDGAEKCIKEAGC